MFRKHTEVFRDKGPHVYNLFSDGSEKSCGFVTV